MGEVALLPLCIQAHVMMSLRIQHHFICHVCALGICREPSCFLWKLCDPHLPAREVLLLVLWTHVLTPAEKTARQEGPFLKGKSSLGLQPDFSQFDAAPLPIFRHLLSFAGIAMYERQQMCVHQFERPWPGQ